MSSRWRRRPETLGSLATPGEAIRGHAAPLTSAGAAHAAQPGTHPCRARCRGLASLLSAALRAMVPSRVRTGRWVAAARAAQRRPRVDSLGQPPSPKCTSTRAALYVHVSGQGSAGGEGGRGCSVNSPPALYPCLTSHLAQHLSTSYATGISVGPKTSSLVLASWVTLWHLFCLTKVGIVISSPSAHGAQSGLVVATCADQLQNGKGDV